MACGVWRVAAGEIIYGTSFWQNVRPSFSQVELKIENLKVQVMYDYAVITGLSITISPIGSDFPTSDNEPFGIHVRYIQGGKTDTSIRYVDDFDGVLRDNRDVYGRRIAWEPVAAPLGYKKPANSNHPHWYKYKNEYGPMIVSQTFFLDAKRWVNLPDNIKTEWEVVMPHDGYPRKLAPLFYGKDSLRKKQFRVSFKGVEFNINAYDKESSLESDRFEFEHLPQSYELLDSRDANREYTLADLREGKWNEQYPHITEYTFHVSYLSHEVQTHAPITIQFNIPEAHYDQDSLVKTIKRCIVNELYDVFRMVNAAAQWYDKNFLELKDSYLTMIISQEKTMEEPSAECPFKPTFEIIKYKVEMHKSEKFWELGLSVKFTSPIQYILGMSPSPNIDIGALDLPLKPWRVPHEIDVNGNPMSTLWVFCDIVKHTFIKNSTAPLLRCMAVDKRMTTQTSYEASHNMHYKPVIASGDVQRIRIWLADNHLGIPMSSHAKTLVRLEFIEEQQQ